MGGDRHMRLYTTTAIAVAATLTAASPASAVITTFAAFSPAGGGGNVRFLNANGNSNAVFSTTATNNSTTLGARRVSFNFMNTAASAIGTVNANWTLNGAVTNTNASIFGNLIIQPNIVGSFSFISTSAITLGSTTYATGSNLLSGTFTNATIAGARNGTSAGFSGSTPSSSIVYTSDFLNLAPGSSYDFGMSLDQISPTLNALPTSSTPTRALRSFRAVAGGQFSSDPAPLAAIPEPATWLQLLADFGIIGVVARRRKRKVLLPASAACSRQPQHSDLKSYPVERLGTSLRALWCDLKARRSPSDKLREVGALAPLNPIKARAPHPAGGTGAPPSAFGPAGG